MTILRPRLRNASSRKRFESVSKENVVSSKIVASGLKRMIVPVFFVDAAVRARRPLLALAPDLDLEPLAERVDDRDADAVEAARHLVRGVIELPARVQDRQDDLGGRLAALLVDVHGNAAAVIADGARAVGVQDDFDVVAGAGERLVHGVVDRLVDELVEAVRARVPDVHRGTLADGLKPLEDLDVTRREIGR